MQMYTRYVVTLIFLSVAAFNQLCIAQHLGGGGPYVPEWKGFMEKNKGLEDSHPHNFTVVLNNDSTFSVGGVIDYHDTYYLRVWEPKLLSISPKETKSITRHPKRKLDLVGIPTDTCWVFKVALGKINSYSFFAETEIGYTKLIQSGDGPIVPLTQSNLMPMLANDSRASKLASEGNLLKAIHAYNKNNSKK
jgi:hypothetical protein